MAFVCARCVPGNGAVATYDVAERICRPVLYDLRLALYPFGHVSHAPTVAPTITPLTTQDSERDVPVKSV